MIYITNVDLVNDYVYTKFGLNRSICFQDIEQLENVFMKHYAPNYTLVSKQNISQIKAKPKSRIIFSNPVASTI